MKAAIRGSQVCSDCPYLKNLLHTPSCYHCHAPGVSLLSTASVKIMLKECIRDFCHLQTRHNWLLYLMCGKSASAGPKRYLRNCSSSSARAASRLMDSSGSGGPSCRRAAAAVFGSCFLSHNSMHNSSSVPRMSWRWFLQPPYTALQLRAKNTGSGPTASRLTSAPKIRVRAAGGRMLRSNLLNAVLKSITQRGGHLLVPGRTIRN